MTKNAAAPATGEIGNGTGDLATPTEETGSALFAELVWAHYWYERERCKPKPGPERDALEKAYTDKLNEFQGTVGSLEHVYWSTREASAVAMTVENNPGKAAWLGHLWPAIVESDQRIRLHRLSDWVTADAPGVADLLHECDLLAIRVGEVLRGTPERIAMRWILGVQEHLVGFIEREYRDYLRTEASASRDNRSENSLSAAASSTPSSSAVGTVKRAETTRAAREKELVKQQHDQLIDIERYYHRAASRSGRLVYITGMLMGLVPVFLLVVLLGFLLWVSGLWDRGAELLVLCAGAGAIGALVSAISRMGKPEQGKFNVDFELGRPLIRRLGLYRPFLGAIFGVALYFLLESGIAQVEVIEDKQLYYYGFAAFLAGFSERFATVMFGSAETRLSDGNSEEEG